MAGPPVDDAVLPGAASTEGGAAAIVVGATADDIEACVAACAAAPGSRLRVVDQIVLDLPDEDAASVRSESAVVAGLRKVRGRRIKTTPLPRWAAWSRELDAALRAAGSTDDRDHPGSDPASNEVDDAGSASRNASGPVVVVVPDKATASRISRVLLAHPWVPVIIGPDAVARWTTPDSPIEPSPVGTDPELLAPAHDRVRVVQLIERGIAGDSRVQKECRSLADLGYESIVLGIDRRGARGVLTLLDQAVVMLAPVQYPISKTANAKRRRRQRDKLGRLARQRSWSRFWSGIQARDGDDPARYWTQIRQPHRQRSLRRGLRARRSQRYEYRAGPQPVVQDFLDAGTPDWELAREASERWPWLQDVETPMGQWIERLNPDVIHANDATLLGVAARTKARMRAAGRPVTLVYDAHEWTLGLERQRGKLEALQLAERAHIHDADVVITVSDTIADRLQREYDLPTRPLVVTNAPVTEWRMPARGDLRSELGLDAQTPILVYLGGIARARGVDLVVDALPALPGVHLVIGSPPKAAVDELLEQADRLGVGDRVHRVDYVDPDEVPAYISTATAGVIPFRAHINSDLALPTKMREYIHAGLPVLCSDRGESGELVRTTGIGETFTTGSATDLARAAATLLADPDRYRARITDELRREHSWEEQVTHLAQAYRMATDVEVQPSNAGPTRKRVLLGPLVGPDSTQVAAALRERGLPAATIQVVRPGEAIQPGEPAVLVADWQRPEVRIELLERQVLPSSHVVISAARPLLNLREIKRADPDSPTAAIADALQLQRSGRHVGLIVSAAEAGLITDEFVEAFDGTLFAADAPTAAAIPAAVPAAVLGSDDPEAVAEFISGWISG